MELLVGQAEIASFRENVNWPRTVAEDMDMFQLVSHSWIFCW